MPEQPTIIANLKSFLPKAGFDNYARALLIAINDSRGEFPGTRVVLCPPATHIQQFNTLCMSGAESRRANIGIGGQTCIADDGKPHTGLITPPMLRLMGATYCIVGHSEQRDAGTETDETVKAAIAALRDVKMTPIVCIGETLEERDGGKTNEVLTAQLTGCFSGLAENVGSKCIVAYEPKWAIGTGRTPTVEQIGETHAEIRRWLNLRFSDFGEDMSILYGGSVKESNMAQIIVIPDVDGALVGGASLVALDFSAIVREANKNWKK